MEKKHMTVFYVHTWALHVLLCMALSSSGCSCWCMCVCICACLCASMVVCVFVCDWLSAWMCKSTASGSTGFKLRLVSHWIKSIQASLLPFCWSLALLNPEPWAVMCALNLGPQPLVHDTWLSDSQMTLLTRFAYVIELWTLAHFSSSNEPSESEVSSVEIRDGLLAR